jgi:thymidylate synthase
MATVTAYTLGECWQKCVQVVLRHGCKQKDEDVAIRELLGLSVQIAHPSSEDSFINRAGDQRVIAKMLKKFSKGVVMEDRPFTYGQLIYDMNGVDQFEWMLRRLREKPETKSAAISLLTPGLDTPNLPCLSVLDAKIRNGQIHLQFFFRSQNVFGRQYANLLALAQLHEDLARRSGCELGTMKGYIASAHIYDYDLADAHELVENRITQVTDHYYAKGPASIRA